MQRFLILFLVFTSMVFAQSSLQKTKQNSNINSTKTFFEIQKEFNEFEKEQEIVRGYTYKNGNKSKAPNWKIFKREEWLWENRINTETGEFPKTNSIAEYEKYKLNKSLKKETSLNESWTNLGTNSSTGGYAGIGRINCIAFHPTDINTFWVGSPSGGIWKTIDGGSNWTILNNNMSVLGVSAIVVDPTNTQIIYIATGDRDGGSMSTLSGGQVADNASIGIYKTTNGGSTWLPTGLTYTTSQGVKVYDLVMDPSDSQTLLASASKTSGGHSNGSIYRTTNGGTNWTETTNSYKVWRFAYKPGNPLIVYGTQAFTGDQWFHRSTDGGATWSEFTFGSGTDAKRTELTVTAADPTLVYLLVANAAGGVNGVYKSTDSGLNFTKVNLNSATEPGMCGYYTDGSGGSGGQGGYDLCIAVDPSNANTVFIGGITTWKSTNAGADWTAINNWTSSATYNKSTPKAPVVHADKHALAYQPVSGALFEGNDGGIYKTTNGGTSWTDLSNGLVISQLYRIGVSQTNSTTVLTGLQDNGSKLFSGSWSDVKGGDGMECIIDYSDANYMYATYIEGQITRSHNGFTDWTTEVDISANITGGQPSGAWVTPYIMDPNNSLTLYAGYDQVWKTTDRGDTWTSASPQLSATDKLRSLAIAPSNSSVLYAADKTNMWKTTDGGSNWTTITLPSTSTSVTYIAVHPTDPNTVWITYGGYVDGQKVYESTDGGANWTSIATGLPNIPIMSIVHYKTVTSKNILFVGTDLGVYAKDGSSNWVEYNTGLPNVVVAELEIYYNPSGADKLRAGTYGRGLWETEILAPLPVELISFTSNQKDNNVILNWTTATEVNNYGFEIERKILKQVQNDSEVWEKVGFAEGHGNSNSPKNYSFYDDKTSEVFKNLGGLSAVLQYRLKQIDTDGSFEYSDEIEVEFESLPTAYELAQNYPNPFNPSTVINFQLPNKGFTSLKVYDILGREVAVLVNEEKVAGKYSAKFDASNLASGIYFSRLTSGNYSSIKKMLLIK